MFFRKKLEKLVSGNAASRVVVNRIINEAEKKRSVEELTSGEKNFWLIRWVIWEVKNGSFHQYLINSTGDDFSEAKQAFEAIGATRVVAIFNQLEGTFPMSLVPRDRETRCKAIQEANADEVLRELSDQFLSELASVYDKMVEFARKNPAQFCESY